MRLGALPIRSDRRLIQPLRLEQQSAIEINLGLRAQRPRPIAGGERCQLPGIHLVHYCRRLFEGRCVKGAHNPLQRVNTGLAHALTGRRSGRRFPRRRQRLCLAVAGPQFQALRHLIDCARRIPVPLQAQSQVEVVVCRVGVGRGRLNKQRSAVFSLPAQGHTLVVHHLGQREHPRHVGKCLCGRRVIA